MNKYSKALDLLLKDGDIRQTLKIVDDKKFCVEFALYCAKRVQHLNNTKVILNTIEAIERWLLNPSEENTKACQKAANTAATYAVCVAANAAAYAAYYAAYTAAYATTYAAYAAYNAAYDAANAAVRSVNNEEEKHYQIQYLKQLLLDKMPEKDKGWFVELMVNAGLKFLKQILYLFEI